MQHKILYQAHRDNLSDDLIVIEKTARNRFLTSIVLGNYPIDYLSKFEAEFDTEDLAVAAADAVREGLIEPHQILREL